MNLRFVKRYREVLAEGFSAMPGVLDILDGLTVPYCVATNSTRLRLEVTLEAAGLAERFAGRAFCLDDVTRGKPAPDLFLHAAKSLGAAPSDAVVVEDSLHGVAAAKAAGMRVFGFTGGSHCPPELADRLAEAGAERVLSSMQALKPLLP
jgi:HAD superfamily hydrolase (TIGR01509 family)